VLVAGDDRPLCQVDVGAWQHDAGHSEGNIVETHELFGCGDEWGTRVVRV